MLCPLCAKENKDDARFCGNCGGSLNAGSGDVLEDVLGLGLPRSAPSAEVGDVGLHDLFHSFSKGPPAETDRSAGAAPRPAAAAPATVPKPVSRSLTIEDLIASAPEGSVTPPSTVEEVAARAARSSRALVPDSPVGSAGEPATEGRQPGHTPPPMPGGGEQQGRQTRVPVFRPAAAPNALTPNSGSPPLTLNAQPSRAERGLLVLANLALLGVLGEMLHQLYAVSVLEAGAAGAAAAIALVALAAKPEQFGAAHLGKVLLLSICFLSVRSYEDAAFLKGHAVFLTAGAPVVLGGVFAAVFVFAGLTFWAERSSARPVRWLFLVLGFYSAVTSVAALAQLKSFDGVLAGEGLAKSFPASAAFLEPAWVGINGLLPLTLVGAFLRFLSAARQKRGSVALSMALTVAVLWNAGRFGAGAMEFHGRPGLRAALARVDSELTKQAATRGLALPELIPAPAPAR